MIRAGRGPARRRGDLTENGLRAEPGANVNGKALHVRRIPSDAADAVRPVHGEPVRATRKLIARDRATAHPIHDAITTGLDERAHRAENVDRREAWQPSGLVRRLEPGWEAKPHAATGLLLDGSRRSFADVPALTPGIGDKGTGSRVYGQLLRVGEFLGSEIVFHLDSKHKLHQEIARCTLSNAVACRLERMMSGTSST